MEAAEALAPEVGVAPVCRALGIARATFYRRRHRSLATPRPRATSQRPPPPLALSCEERQSVLSVLYSERFVDQPPDQVYATLLDEGIYLCSARTMCRLLARQGQLHERRNQLRHPHYPKPQLVATAPNQVWTWDITKLRGPGKWCLYYLYVILDLFSRYVVGWMLDERDTEGRVQHLLSQTLAKYDIPPGQLTLHGDRGPTLTALSVLQLLTVLGVTPSHSRPRTSDDNPFSEAQFKTLKYHPGYPDRFESMNHARSFCRDLLSWYNHDHRHSGLAYLTPADVHFGRAPAILARRERVLELAFRQHPERFKGRVPKPPALPQAVWINPPATPAEGGTLASDFVNDTAQVSQIH